jgi:hypothetical protein
VKRFLAHARHRVYIPDVSEPEPVPSKDYARQHRTLWLELRAALERAFFTGARTFFGHPVRS